MINAFPKIFTLGQDYIKDIFSEDIEITEKIDGSQWCFGKVNGELMMRSKGKVQFQDAIDHMFKEAADYVFSISNKLPDNTIFYTEYLRTPTHNAISYKSIPKNYLVLFGVKVGEIFVQDYDSLKKYADYLNIDVAPLIYSGKIHKPEEVIEMIDRESFLGGSDVEGVVIKNYHRPFLLGGQPIPLMAGKFVSEKFKEVNRSNFKKNFTHQGKWDTFKKTFKTEARWAKSVQHLSEKGELENSPRDIGKLIVEIKKDITEEEKENIKEFLWREHGSELLRQSVGGFPEWYKEHLLKKSFNN